jgi:hypothetical protein
MRTNVCSPPAENSAQPECNGQTLDWISCEWAGHTVTAATPSAQFGSLDRDNFDASFAQLGIGVVVAIVGNHLKKLLLFFGHMHVPTLVFTMLAYYFSVIEGILSILLHDSVTSTWHRHACYPLVLRQPSER